MNSLKKIVKSNLCLGCGLCVLNPKEDNSKVVLKYSSKRGHNIPKISDLKSENAKVGFDLCPGKGYRIESLAREFGLGENYQEFIGYYDSLKVVTNKNINILKNAASSGIMTLILDFMINNNIIDKAIVTKFEYSEKGIRASAFSTSKYEDLIEAQGSKYCPVDLGELVKELKKDGNHLRYAFVGTPCQIAGLRYIQNNIKDLGIKFFIGNFCGGYKSYNNLNRLIKLNETRPEQVKYFRFRGGGQPGSLRIETEKLVKEIPYPEYVKMTGYSKLKRCHFCVDATAELADFSCGDAWLKEYLDTKKPTSIVITRTKDATDILYQIFDKGLITLEEIEAESVIESQKGNIKSKKIRQLGRIKFYKLLGIKIPEIEEGYLKKGYSLLTEFNVFISHKVKFLFEKMGLFYFFYYKNRFFRKVLFKLFRDNYN